VVSLDRRKETDANNHQKKKQLPALSTHRLTHVEVNVIFDANIRPNRTLWIIIIINRFV